MIKNSIKSLTKINSSCSNKYLLRNLNRNVSTFKLQKQQFSTNQDFEESPVMKAMKKDAKRTHIRMKMDLQREIEARKRAGNPITQQDMEHQANEFMKQFNISESDPNYGPQKQAVLGLVKSMYVDFDAKDPVTFKNAETVLNMLGGQMKSGKLSVESMTEQFPELKKPNTSIERWLFTCQRIEAGLVARSPPAIKPENGAFLKLIESLFMGLPEKDQIEFSKLKQAVENGIVEHHWSRQQTMSFRLNDSHVVKFDLPRRTIFFLTLTDSQINEQSSTFDWSAVKLTPEWLVAIKKLQWPDGIDLSFTDNVLNNYFLE